MKRKKLLYAILCALGSGTVGFFANQLTELYGCIFFGIGVGNGDIVTPIDAKNMFDYTKCDGIMIARASMGNPWIFAMVKEYLKVGEVTTNPTTNEKIDMAIRHLDLSVNYKGEYTAVREMRKNLFAYIKNFPKATELRNLISRIDNYDELINLLKSKQVESNV